VKLTVTFVLFHPLLLGVGETLVVASGGVLSIFTAGEVTVALLPALSVTVTVPITAAPSVEKSSGLVVGFVLATPEGLPLAVKGIVTLVLFHPAGLGAGFGAPNVTVGGVLPMLMPVMVAGALTLPALSVQVPEPDCPLPSPSNVICPVQKSMPDPKSVPVEVTVTLVLFQPLAFGTGIALAIATGGVLSIFIVALTGALVFPALSIQNSFNRGPLKRTRGTPSR